jgi:hypothetical protein
MKPRKTFISPRVLQTCEVALEAHLLGASQEVGRSSSVIINGHEVETYSDGSAAEYDNNWGASSFD